MHGGFSPQILTRDNLAKIIKPTNDPITGIETDFLWSNFDDCVDEWEENIVPISDSVLGVNATDNFLKRYGFTKTVRSHQSVEGYDWVFGPAGGCLTVFSPFWGWVVTWR
jgi:serine/threonine-protein phosphatase PP1 catalytic subunit